MKTPPSDRLGIAHPIVQAPMAAAVSNAGARREAAWLDWLAVHFDAQEATAPPALRGICTSFHFGRPPPRTTARCCATAARPRP